MAPDVEQARESFELRARENAYRLLSAADQRGEIGGEDLERLAVAAYLRGRDQASVEGWTCAYQQAVRLRQSPLAARYAFWAAFILLYKGESAAGGAWVRRA